MIPSSPVTLATPQWQRELAASFTTPSSLLEFLGIDPKAVGCLAADGAGFPMRVTPHFARLMRRGDPDDPLLAQVLPVAAERQAVPGFSRDPVGDLSASMGHGLLQKYAGRALAVVTGACAVHCRYCFRRHFPYQEQTTLRHWQLALASLRDRADITELILSGGDPLSLSDARLGKLVAETEKLIHIKRLRIHTRQPVVLPSRVTETLCDILGSTPLRVVVVLHVNHPNEISSELADAAARLQQAGCRLLNQSVLLKNVNDDADTLVNLSESLFEAGIMPYYLHLLDAVEGAAHFAVEASHAATIERDLRSRLPGYLVPKMVREIAGADGKTPFQAA